MNDNQKRRAKPVLLEGLNAIKNTNIKADCTNLIIYLIESILSYIGCNSAFEKTEAKNDNTSFFLALKHLGELVDVLVNELASHPLPALNLLGEEIAVYATQVLASTSVKADLIEKELDMPDLLSSDGFYHFREGEIMIVGSLALFLKKNGRHFDILANPSLKGPGYLMAKYNLNPSDCLKPDHMENSDEISDLITENEQKEVVQIIKMLRRTPVKPKLSCLLADVLEGFFTDFYGMSFSQPESSDKAEGRDQLFIGLCRIFDILARTLTVQNLWFNPKLFDQAKIMHFCINDYITSHIKKVSLRAFKKVLKDKMPGGRKEGILPELGLSYKRKKDQIFLEYGV